MSALRSFRFERGEGVVVVEQSEGSHVALFPLLAIGDRYIFALGFCKAQPLASRGSPRQETVVCIQRVGRGQRDYPSRIDLQSPYLGLQEA